MMDDVGRVFEDYLKSDLLTLFTLLPVFPSFFNRSKYVQVIPDENEDTEMFREDGSLYMRGRVLDRASDRAHRQLARCSW